MKTPLTAWLDGVHVSEVGLDGSEPPFPLNWSGPRDDDSWNRRVPLEDPRTFAMLQDLRSLPEPEVEEAAGRVRLEASLKGVLVELAERWSLAREDLWQSDLRPVWMHPEDHPVTSPAPKAAPRRSFLDRMRTLARDGFGLRKAA